MKKKVLLLVSGLVLIPLMSLWLCSLDDKVSNKENKINQKSTIAMYIEGEDGEYNQSNESTFPKQGYILNVEKSTCRNGGSLSQDAITKAISLSVGNAESCTLYFDKDESSASKDTLAILGITSNGEKNNFNEPATTDEGVFEMEDDYGTSYYYRGAVTNNYVNFAGFYWRIIRVNGDGSLRVLYDGTQAYANGTFDSGRVINTTVDYNTEVKDNKYIGWMYGPAGTTASISKKDAQTNIEDSTIKGVIDAWYKINIEDKGYGNAISDTLFCNDRSTPGKEVTEYSSDTGLGYGENITAYGAFARMAVGVNEKTVTPTFKCAQKNDAFTVKDTRKGNGALTYPVGLITADEIVTAGSGKIASTNKNYYLYKGYNYWSLTPSYYNFNHAWVFRVTDDGKLANINIGPEYAAAPVINLSSEYVKTLSGTGTMTDPYQTV